MKKVLLLMVGAIVAIAAQAQLYLCGDNISWDSDSPKEVALSDGWYSFQVSGGFKMSRAKGDWTAFNRSSLNFDETKWTDNGQIKENTLTASTTDTGNKTAPDGYSYLRVSSDFTKIQASKDGNFETRGGGDDVVGDNTFYFYDCNNANYTDVYTYVYGNGASMSGPEKMTSTGKYVREGDNYYPVWSYTPSVQPSNVMFTKDSGWNNKLSTQEPTYVKGGFYYLSGSSLLSKTGLVLVDKEEPATVYELWTNFRNGDTFVGKLLNEENNYSFTLEFLGDETGTKAGLHVDGEWRGASNTSAYDGNAKTYNMTTTEGGDITFAEGLKGAVTFVLNVADNTLSVSGGTIEQGGGDDDENSYTIYFYDRNNVGTDIYVHIWTGEATFKPWGKDNAIKMQPTGKYIFRDNNYYPLYVLNFSWNKTPEKILIWNGDATSEKKFVTDIVFVNNGYYTNGATVVETDLSPVDMGTAQDYIYFHLKEDLIYEGINAAETPVYCNVLNNGNYIGDFARDEAHKMELVSSKYQIYRYKLSEAEAEGNDVEFSFQNRSGLGKDWATFRATLSEKFNQARWTEFIYATAKRGINGVDTQYAVQTYITWPEFAELDAQGRPALYLVGEGAIDGLGWDPTNPMTYLNQDGSCFYIPVTITGTKLTFFKMSWVNAGYYKEHATPGMTNDARDWATFDLGIVGVDDKFAYPDNSYVLNIVSGGTLGQDVNCTVFATNTSVKYCNYNQYNWTIEGTKLTPGQYYVVVDTHDTCRTVTLVNFDPNPSVKVSDTEINTITLEPDQAIALHHHYDHLGLASHNGHIPMDKVNTCEGTLTIAGSSGLDINNAGFDIQYTVSMNGDEVVSYTGKPGSIHMKYLPLASSNDIEIRAMYTDVARDGRNGTGLTFHSRRGEASVEIPATMPAPVATINSSLYVKPADDAPYGVLLDDITLECVTDYNVYGDLTFDFDVPDADTSRRVEIIHENHQLYPLMDVSVLNGWTPLVLSEENDFANYDFEGGSNDWSSKIIQEGVNVPVFLSRYTDITSKELLEDKTVTGMAYAIYPFIYETSPSVEVVPENGSSAPRKAPAEQLPNDMSGFAISQFARSTPISIDVDAKGAISGVENVAADMVADGDAEYYTISGVRVQGAPAPGIYLRRQGDKVAKVVVR